MKNRVLVLLVIAAIVIFALAKISGGGIGDLLSYDCRRAGEAMQVNWMWDPGKGCFIQQPNGSWMPVDNNRTYQP